MVTKDDVEDLEEDEEDEAIIIPNPEPEEHWEREETGPEEKAEEAPPEAEYQEPEYPEPEGVQELEMKQEDLEEVAMLYDSIRALRRKTKPEMDKVLAADFDKSIKTMMNQYKSNTNTKDPIQIKNTYILKAKYGLFGICFEKIIEHVKTVDPPHRGNSGGSTSRAHLNHRRASRANPPSDPPNGERFAVHAGGGQKGPDRDE